MTVIFVISSVLVKNEIFWSPVIGLACMVLSYLLSFSFKKNGVNQFWPNAIGPNYLLLSEINSAVFTKFLSSKKVTYRLKFINLTLRLPPEVFIRRMKFYNRLVFNWWFSWISAGKWQQNSYGGHLSFVNSVFSSLGAMNVPKTTNYEFWVSY